MISDSNAVIVEKAGNAGLITLNRPSAINALTLPMVKNLTLALTKFRSDPDVAVVCIRGTSKWGLPGTDESFFGAFCAGGDLRFFYEAALTESPLLGEFFTAEYRLNYLIHTYPKPYVAFMDGIVMGGGMGLSQGARIRIVTENTKMAMPETTIGLFPDVGAGHFLSRCPGHAGEYLGLTGEVLTGDQAIEHGLADIKRSAHDLRALWSKIANAKLTSAGLAEAWLAAELPRSTLRGTHDTSRIDQIFSLPSVIEIIEALEKADPCADEWFRITASTLRNRSPLMLHVTLEQIRRARRMTLAEDLRMERDIVDRCFGLRPGPMGETVEGIRALIVKKDRKPKWNPSRIEDVDPNMVEMFFCSPWNAEDHPLRGEVTKAGSSSRLRSARRSVRP